MTTRRASVSPSRSAWLLYFRGGGTTALLVSGGALRFGYSFDSRHSFMSEEVMNFEDRPGFFVFLFCWSWAPRLQALGIDFVFLSMNYINMTR